MFGFRVRALPVGVPTGGCWLLMATERGSDRHRNGFSQGEGAFFVFFHPTSVSFFPGIVQAWGRFFFFFFVVLLWCFVCFCFVWLFALVWFSAACVLSRSPLFWHILRPDFRLCGNHFARLVRDQVLAGSSGRFLRDFIHRDGPRLNFWFCSTFLPPPQRRSGQPFFVLS